MNGQLALWRLTQTVIAAVLFTSCGTSLQNSGSTTSNRTAEKFNISFLSTADATAFPPCIGSDCVGTSPQPTPTPSATPSGTVAPSPSSQPSVNPSGSPQPSVNPSGSPQPSASPSVSPSAKPDDDDDDKGDDPEGDDPHLNPKLDDDESKACSNLLGVDVKRIHIAKGGPVAIDTDQALAIKVTGDEQEVSVTVNSTSKDPLPGICVFMAGNQSKIHIDAKSDVKKIYYVGRGNKSCGAVTVEKGATVSTVHSDLAGNQSSLKVSGDGMFSCESDKLRGHDPNLICK